jgi:type II secretory pathway pseudopilin PulG
MAARTGFTLVETLVCCFIVALLLGLVYAGLAPAREKARQTTCLSNLHQIGKAIEMYRQDYGRGDPPAALTQAQLGLPVEPSGLLSYLKGGKQVFLCADEWLPPGIFHTPVDSSGMLIAYMWCPGAVDGETHDGVPSFARQVSLRGSDTPVVIDAFHWGADYGRNSNQPWLRKIMVLRLDGRVDSRIRDDSEVRASWLE